MTNQILADSVAIQNVLLGNDRNSRQAMATGQITGLSANGSHFVHFIGVDGQEQKQEVTRRDYFRINLFIDQELQISDYEATISEFLAGTRGY